MGKSFTVLFKYYTQAELRKLEAAGFINEDGSAEYVVSVSSTLDTNSAKEFLLAQEGVTSVRPTDFTNWYVVEISDLIKLSVQRIRSLDLVEFVFANRGLWFCH